MNIQKKRLKNGLRVITVPMKDSPTVTALVMVQAGSKYETKNQNGLSHFLEHMCFKGTTKRPKSLDISRELDGLGAQNNAFTSFEYTGYYAKAHPKHLKKIVDVLGDLYLNPVFPEAEIEKEKGVIIEEMNMYEDLPQRQVGTLFMDLLYGDQPAGWSILGDRKVIQGATQSDFVSYRKDHYVASATTVVVAGNIGKTDVSDLVAKTFVSISDSKKKSKLKVSESQKKPEIRIKQKETDQTHLILGFRTFPVNHAKMATLQVLNAVLGQGMSSRLFQRLREEMGVGYYVRSGTDEFTDHGYIAVATGVDTKRFKEVVRAILEEIKRFKTELVSNEELLKAKECLVGNFVMDLESSDAVAEFVGTQEILKGAIEHPRDIERKVRAVTSAQVKALANTIFTNDRLNLAVIGNVAQDQDLKNLLKL